MIKRVVLFIATNLAINVLLNIVLSLLGVDSLLAKNGSDLDVRNLLVFALVVGFTGSFVSLAISSGWRSARWASGDHPAGDSAESWPRQYRAALVPAGRHRHAGSRRIRVAGAECLATGAPQLRTGRGQQRPR
jgi:hypothetical protein